MASVPLKGNLTLHTFTRYGSLAHYSNVLRGMVVITAVEQNLVGRLVSGVRVSAGFQKIPRLVLSTTGNFFGKLALTCNLLLTLTDPRGSVLRQKRRERYDLGGFTS